MRVLITGAAGFVGRYLINHLLQGQRDAEVVGVVHVGHPLPDAPDGRVRFASCDITANRGADIAALIRTTQPDHIYHLAGMASAASDDQDLVFRTNVDGTRYVMDAAAKLATSPHLLFVSTGYVYGPCDLAHPAREEDALAPPGRYNAYTDSKREAEAPARAAGAVIARAFNHTGPGQTDAFAVPAFARQIARIEKGQQPPQMQVGNLEARRDFLDVRDVVRAYHLLMERGEAGETYNVCSGDSVLMQEALDDLIALSSVPIEVVSDPERMRPSDIPVSVGDPAKLKTLTGWQPHIPFAQTLRDTLDWWRAR